MEDSYGTKYNYLHPYIHQVGGHSSMLCLDEATVCKPVVERELLFYECLPQELRAFAPEYYGIIQVNVLSDGEYITLVGTAPLNYTLTRSSKFKSRLRFRRNGSLERDVETVNLFEEDSSSNGHNSVPTGMNPWVIKCHRDHLASLAAAIEEKKSPKNFLVLENLTRKFRLPCILDLKMGTRQYDDNDSLTKRQSKMVKVVSTTSGKLGVRMGGMQVYQVTSGRFVCRNKLYGRSLSASGFSAAVRHFLHDGERLRSEILPPLIRKLENLSSVVGHQDSLRLYTTSLLLLYDGAPVFPPVDRLREKRESMAKASSTEEAERDDDEPSLERSRSSSSLDKVGNDARALYRRRRSSCAPPPETTIALDDRESDCEPLTDVRIIDFAHSTHNKMSDGVVYTGPDNGFLFGLENMIAVLKNIHQEYRQF